MGDFAAVIPTKRSTYTFGTQDSYYDQYATSLFGITMKKAGWDCMRHYEILAAGAVPYMLDLELIPEYTMMAFPKRLFREALGLPGMPSSAAVREAVVSYSDAAAAADPSLERPMPKINRALFDTKRYCEIREKLINYTESYLTTTALASYVIDQVQVSVGLSDLIASTSKADTELGSVSSRGGEPERPQAKARILFISVPEVGYQSMMLYHGLYLKYGDSMSSFYGRKEALFKDHTGDSVYGRGYSYQGVLETPDLFKKFPAQIAEAKLKEQMMSRLRDGYFNLIIIVADCNRCCQISACFPEVPSIVNDYVRKQSAAASPVRIVTVDGNDSEQGCHGESLTHAGLELSHIDLHFVRETENPVNGYRVRSPSAFAPPGKENILSFDDAVLATAT